MNAIRVARGSAAALPLEYERLVAEVVSAAKVDRVEAEIALNRLFAVAGCALSPWGMGHLVLAVALDLVTRQGVPLATAVAALESAPILVELREPRRLR